MSVSLARRLLPSALALFTGCSNITDARNEAALGEVRAQERAWNSANVKDYSMIVVRRCVTCPVQVPGPVRVEVVAGIVVSQTLTSNGAAVAEAARPLVPGVDGLFAELKRLLQQQWRSMESTYDPELGYPTHIRIDFDQTQTADDVTITVSDFMRPE